MIPTNPFKTYTSPKGLEYRVTGLEKLEDTIKFIGREPHWCWEVSIQYLESKKRVKITYSHEKKVIKVLNN